MREIRTSGLMSGDGKRGTATAPVLDSTGALRKAHNILLPQCFVSIMVAAEITTD